LAFPDAALPPGTSPSREDEEGRHDEGLPEAPQERAPAQGGGAGERIEPDGAVAVASGRRRRWSGSRRREAASQWNPRTTPRARLMARLVEMRATAAVAARASRLVHASR
jgi:hypothetical protein